MSCFDIFGVKIPVFDSIKVIAINTTIKTINTPLEYLVTSDSENIKFLSPKGSNNSYFAEFGWVTSNNKNIELPDANTIWKSDRSILSSDNPIVLSWDNGNGLIFKKTISIDNEYMFNIQQTVINNTSEEIILYPYGLINRTGLPKLSGLFILHEGPIGVLNDRVKK